MALTSNAIQPVDGHDRPGGASADRRGLVRARTPGRAFAAAAMLVTMAAGADGARAAEVTVVVSSKASPYAKAEKELRARLAKLGHNARTVELAELAKSKPARPGDSDVYVAVGTPATAWLKTHLPGRAPLVYCMTSEAEAPVQDNGRKLAGVSTRVPLHSQFGLIAEALPKATKMGVLYHSDNKNSVSILEGVKVGLPKSWQLHAVAVDKHESPAKAIAALLSQGVDVVWTAPDSSVYGVATVRSLLLAAIRSRTPVFGFSPAFVRAGALLGVGIDPTRQGRQAAGLVDPLLKAAKETSAATTRPKPESLTAEPEFEIAVNLVVARALSITLPKGLVDRAAHVIGAEGEVEK